MKNLNSTAKTMDIVFSVLEMLAKIAFAGIIAVGFAFDLDPDMIGIGYVQAVPLDDGGWEIGYHIGSRYTRQGYATEAVKAFLPVILPQIGVNTVAGICRAANVASVKVLQRCGFVKEFEGMSDYQGQEQMICKFHFTL